MNSQRKITILGAGHVGSHCAMALAAGAVCEEIVSMHGGELIIANADDGEGGCQVTICLPLG